MVDQYPIDEGLATSYVGKYTLYSTIGEGAFGKVKLAVDKETKARVAVKIMDKREIRDQDFTSQVRREIYIMRALKHKHIVRLLEVLTSDTRLYIVMELVTGGELFEKIEHGRVAEPLARKYFQQLVDAVDFCHKRGVAHRDLKPENLLVDENGDIKITDFGFSSMKGRDVNAGLLYTQCGTPDYCAPEIIDCAENGYNGAKVDAWSCGIVLFALLCGRLPFQQLDTDKLYDLILACNVRYPSFIPSGAKNLLEHLLVRDPSKRFNFQEVKRHPWFLVNYEGDDARLIKKRPFFNKNQKDLTNPSSSNPHSPVTAPVHPILPIGVPLPPTSAASSSSHQPHAFQSPSLPPTSNTFDNPIIQQQNPQSSYPAPPSTTYQHLHQVNIRNNNLAGKPMPPVPKHRDEHYAIYKPQSPANEVDAQMRSSTPPTHAVITRVDDRPVTPARRHISEKTSAAFKAAQAAAAQFQTLPLSPTFAPNCRMSPNPNSHGVGPAMTGQQYSVFDGRQQSAGLSYESSRVVGGQFPGEVLGSQDQDDSSSEQDSIEDYVEKPALRLELPMEPIDRLRSSAQSRSQQMHSLTKQRHRSDLGFPAASGGPRLGSPNAVDHGPASMSSVQLQRRGFTRDVSSATTDPRSLRVQLSSEVPSSPPVVYSPSGYDRYRSMSPGFNARVGLVSDSISPNGSHQPGISGFPSPWQGNSSGYGYSSSRDEGGSSGGASLQSDIVARHLWNMVCKLRGTDKPAGQKLSEDLRADFRIMLTEMNQMTRSEDVASIFTSFLSLFETLGLSDGPASSPSFAPQNRSRGTSDMDEEFEDGTTIESKEDYSANGDVRYGNARRTGTDMSSDEVRSAMTRRTVTDMSSEEEPLSWSPVIAETTRHQSDLARRRNISDLLNRMLKRTTRPPAAGDIGERPVFAADEEDQPTSDADMKELQRLMREHHSERGDSNIAEDFLKLINNDVVDANNTSFPLGQSPTKYGPSSRGGDSFALRYQSSGSNTASNNRPNTPLRSVSGSNVPLPSEYVPGRFQEPNSMPARGSKGGQRQNGFGSHRGESDGDEIGDTIGGNRKRDNMASSMGMHDVAYYGPDRKNGVATKLRGVLQTMKVKNQKLGERHAQFRSTLAPDEIMRLLGRILKEMGADVTIKKETKRKMKCKLEVKHGWVLMAGIELTGVEEGVTLVAFRRSRQDKGRTDTESFHSFFENVRKQFINEANVLSHSNRGTSTGKGRRRNGNAAKVGCQISESAGHLTLS